MTILALAAAKVALKDKPIVVEFQKPTTSNQKTIDDLAPGLFVLGGVGYTVQQSEQWQNVGISPTAVPEHETWLALPLSMFIFLRRRR